MSPIGGWIRNFLDGRNDPSRAWASAPAPPLEVDLDGPSLCGVTLGDPPSLLSQFGRPDNRAPFRETVFWYLSQGFEVDVDGEGRIDGFCFYWIRPGSQSTFHAFEGSFRWKGRRLPIGAATTLAEAEEFWGEPYWRDVDPDETLLFYEHGNVEWQVEFGSEGLLAVLVIHTPPLLADAKQRESYGVDRPWPPPAA